MRSGVVAALLFLILALPALSFYYNKPGNRIAAMASTSSSHQENEIIEDSSKNDAVAGSSTVGRQEQTNSRSNEKHKKVIYGIRHGTSESNEFMSIEGNRWGDTTFCDDMKWRDSPLSDTGKQEADRVAERLQQQQQQQQDDDDTSGASADAWLQDVELVVVSPLTRCLMTHDIGVRPALLARKMNIPVIVLPLITERVYTAADVGQTISDLQKKWKDEFVWEEALSNFGADEAWWYQGRSISNDSGEDGHDDEEEWRPHGEGQYYAVPGEPESAFEDRMARADEWINLRHEKTIMVVAHWGVLQHWTGEEVNNGDILRIEWKMPSAAAENDN